MTSDDEIVIALNLQRPIICCIHDAMSGRSTPVLRVGHVLHPIDGGFALARANIASQQAGSDNTMKVSLAV